MTDALVRALDLLAKQNERVIDLLAEIRDKLDDVESKLPDSLGVTSTLDDVVGAVDRLESSLDWTANGSFASMVCGELQWYKEHTFANRVTESLGEISEKLDRIGG
ncbi:hypothetical protein [Pseudaquabacterium pictum]|nr:hypothetical protein [Rubrivivax pictus]